jgi:hypothetical protein
MSFVASLIKIAALSRALRLASGRPPVRSRAA